MSHSTYFAVSGVLFAVLALAHLFRIIFGWTVFIGQAAVPIWVSYAGFLIGGGLALWAFRLSTSHRKSR